MKDGFNENETLTINDMLLSQNYAFKAGFNQDRNFVVQNLTKNYINGRKIRKKNEIK